MNFCDEYFLNIACNDDALKSIKLIIETLAKAIADKKNDIKVYASKEEQSEGEEQHEEMQMGEKPGAKTGHEPGPVDKSKAPKQDESKPHTHKH